MSEPPSWGPDLYRRNGFRVTGLPVDATAESVRRRRGPRAPGVTRAELAAAYARLGDPRTRLLDELTWLWSPQGAPPPPGVSGASARTHDRAVVAHGRALELESVEAAGGHLTDELRRERDEAWGTAMRSWRAVVADDEVWRHLARRSAGIGAGPDVGELRAGLVPALLAVSAGLAVAGPEARTRHRAWMAELAGPGAVDRALEAAAGAPAAPPMPAPPVRTTWLGSRGALITTVVSLGGGAVVAGTAVYRGELDTTSLAGWIGLLAYLNMINGGRIAADGCVPPARVQVLTILAVAVVAALTFRVDVALLSASLVVWARYVHVLGTRIGRAMPSDLLWAAGAAGLLAATGWLGPDWSVPAGFLLLGACLFVTGASTGTGASAGTRAVLAGLAAGGYWVWGDGGLPFLLAGLVLLVPGAVITVVGLYRLGAAQAAAR